jgi:peptide/nickel transport system permease protein
VLVVVTAVAFAMFTYLGDPLVAILGIDSSPDQRAQLRRELGLDQSVFVQFGGYLARVASGEFGISYRLGRPVDAILFERLPATVELAAAACCSLSSSASRPVSTRR